MAHKITEECIACGACEPECPITAISEGDPLYVIDQAKCVDCVGYKPESQCELVCPVGACVMA